MSGPDRPQQPTGSFKVTHGKTTVAGLTSGSESRPAVVMYKVNDAQRRNCHIFLLRRFVGGGFHWLSMKGQQFSCPLCPNNETHPCLIFDVRVSVNGFCVTVMWASMGPLILAGL